MESLQLAQMLADLSDLNAAEPEAATALVNANKVIQGTATPTEVGALKVPDQRRHQRVPSSSAVVSRTASPARFDNFGRRILTPPITRSNSTQGSIPGTPKREFDPEGDIERASTLMALYEIRNRLKQQDNSSMAKAREKIAALAAKQQAQMSTVEKHQHQGAPARNSQYTYPKKP